MQRLKVCYRGCLIVLLLCSCSPGPDVANVEKEIAHFHELLAAGKFQEIYSASANELRNTVSEKDFTDLVSAVKRKLGALQSSQRLNWQKNYINGDSFIVVTLKSQYEGGEATEKFKYKLDGQTYRLSEYSINSNALMTK